MREVTGTILDNETKQPIDSVFIFIVKKNRSTENSCYTDKYGKFKLNDISSGLFNCPDIKVFLTKKGYKDLELVLPNYVDTTICLRK